MLIWSVYVFSCRLALISFVRLHSVLIMDLDGDFIGLEVKRGV